MDLENLPDDLFRIVVDAFPAPLFLVDDDVRVVACNRAGKEMLSGGDQYSRQRGGDLLGCIHALGEDARCGTTEHCGSCVIRRSTHAACRGRRITREKTRMELRTSEGTFDSRFLMVTASPFDYDERRMALLVIEDVTDTMKLKALLPVCAGCKKVRDDDDYWKSVEEYLGEDMDMQFTHGLCPDCIERLYPEYGPENRKDGRSG